MTEESDTGVTVHLDPTPRDEMQKIVEDNAKGFDVFRFGSGLGFVPSDSDRIETGPTALVEDHGWVVTGFRPNFKYEEVGLFIEPATNLLEEADE